MGWRDWVRWWRRGPPVDRSSADPSSEDTTAPTTEARRPRIPQPPSVEPIGFGVDGDIPDPRYRKDPFALVAAMLRSAHERQRAVRYRDFEVMDTSDIAAMLDAVVDTLLTFDEGRSERGCKIESDDPAVATLLQTTFQQIRLGSLLSEVARDMLKYGDAFLEPLWDGAQLVGVQTYRPSEITVTVDAKGRLARGRDGNGFPLAYQQRRNGVVVAGWEPWEMIHAKLVPSRKTVYSERSLLDPLRMEWRKLQLVEQGLVVARITRAYPRRVHYIDVTGKDRTEQEETVKRYIARVARRAFGQRAQSPDGLPVVDIAEDLFITTGYDTGPDGKPYPKLNKTEIEDPHVGGLAELADVQYLRQKVWASVPSEIVGIRRGATTEIDSQDLAFMRLLRRCQERLQVVVRALADLVLLANGILPQRASYTVVFPTLDVRASWKHADAKFRASMTLRNYVEMGVISRRFALKHAYNLTDQEVDEVWRELEQERAQRGDLVDDSSLSSTELGQQLRGHFSGG